MVVCGIGVVLVIVIDRAWHRLTFSPSCDHGIVEVVEDELAELGLT